ncbi:MAG: threonine dehydratase [Candidatus Saccharibacteria bacterium]|nr:threonine dehydratase [Candidatus Saccharibacteria bacterium]
MSAEKYNVLEPYALRVESQYPYETLRGQSHVTEEFPVIPDIPDDLMSASDEHEAFTPAERERLYSSQDGDPMSGYPYNSAIRKGMLYEQRAAERLAVTGLQRLPDDVLTTLRTQKLLKGVTVRTSLEAISGLVDGSAALLLKQETEQPIGAYKLRGAYNMMRKLTDEQRARGVITASTGNHARAVAMSGELLGVSVTVVMPYGTPEVKILGAKELHANVVMHGENFDEAKAHCQELRAQSEGLTYVPPYDHEDIITGQGTIGAEILQQLEEGNIPYNQESTYVFVPVGGAGLIAGIARYVKQVRPHVQVIGVEPENCDAFARSLEAGQRVTLDTVDPFADGVAVRRVGELSFRIARAYVDGVVRVGNREISSAMVDLDAQGMRTEPAGALALAGVRAFIERTGKSGVFVAIRSGQNVDDTKMHRAVELANS